MGASQAPDAGAVPVWRSKFYIMIRITNQKEFEKCLPMLDSPDVECRLLGWELLCGCTDLRGDAALVWNYNRHIGDGLKSILSISNEYPIDYSNGKIIYMPYSSLIKCFIMTSKIFFGKDYLTLRNGRTSQ